VAKVRRKKCKFCKKSFTQNGRGRRRDYCKPTHRQRAYEARRHKRLLESPLYALQQDLGTVRLRGLVRQIVVGVLREYGFLPESDRASVVKLVKPKENPSA
jgi:hypothetical protein